MDITPPITPLKSRRNLKKDLTPINVGLAQNHFKDAWSLTFRLPSLSSPPPSTVNVELDVSSDSLDTPPLSAASSSLSTAGLGGGGGGVGGLTTPLDAVHPLFGRMSLGGDGEVDPFVSLSGGEGGKMVLGEDEDVFGSIPTRRLLFDPPTSSATTNSPNIIPPTPLLSSSSSTFSPPANPFSFDIDTTQYSYTSSTDSLHFFDPSPSISPSRSPSSPETPKNPSKTPSSSPSKTPKAQHVKENSKKKHRSRRSGKARALGLTGSSGGERSGGSTRDASSPRTTPKEGKGRAEAEPSSPFAEADHSVLRMPIASSPSRAALQPAPELFTSGYKTVTAPKSARTFSPMSSPVRGVQQRRRVPLGLSSSA
ncbi:hypothetical protein FRC04_007346 [Tulasnella sp. 424]|nr:hypothetical protein FRC04_007346 [Tulasnella sp. 424]KAG8959675.1 hypothetical protein FRC05_007592 [Tulasnella sp. 425]